MSQRNPMNERYNQDKLGKTRKSAAAAKPKSTRAATLKDPAPKTKKQKKQERKERERKAQETAEYIQQRYEDTPGYKKLRKIWWICLAGAVGVTALSVFINAQGNSLFAEDPDARLFGFMDIDMVSTVGGALMAFSYAFIIGAFYIDLGKIRKERKLFNASLANDNTKEGRAAVKRAKAEQRRQEQERAAKRAELEAKRAEEPQVEPPKRGPMAWLRRGKDDAAQAKEKLQEKAEEVKEASKE